MQKSNTGAATKSEPTVAERIIGLNIQHENPAAYIFQEDALAFLETIPDDSVDLIITDPAYSGMNQHLMLGKGRIVGKYSDKSENGKWFEEFHDTSENYSKFLSECKRILKKDRHIYIMFDSYSLLTLAPLVRDYFDIKNIITWDKVNIGMGHYFRRRHEFIVFGSKGKRPLASRSFPDVWRIKRITPPIIYPTQKPVEVFEAMISASAEESFLVCDPFVGSGSSAIAAIKRKCNFIGADISPKAIQVANDRIAEYLASGNDLMQKNSKLVEGENYGWLNKNGKLK